MDSKRMFIGITTWVFPPATYLHGLVMIEIDCVEDVVNFRVSMGSDRDWQRVQKTTLVSTCYRALGLMDSKRMFMRITTWVFSPAP